MTFNESTTLEFKTVPDTAVYVASPLATTSVEFEEVQATMFFIGQLMMRTISTYRHLFAGACAVRGTVFTHCCSVADTPVSIRVTFEITIPQQEADRIFRAIRRSFNSVLSFHAFVKGGDTYVDEQVRRMYRKRT